MTSCGSPTPPAPTPAPASSRTDVIYVEVVREHQPKLDTLTDQQLISFAHKACDALDSCASLDNVLLAVSASVQDKSLVLPLDYALGAGIESYCPQYSLTSQDNA